MKPKLLILRILALLLATTAAGTAALLMTFRPEALELPTVDVGELPAASPPAEMTVSAISTGTYETQAAFAFRGGAWSDLRPFAMTSLLVRHPKGNLLIDSGAGKNVDAHLLTIPAMQRASTKVTKGVPAAAQLAAAGLKPTDLAGVIPTHAHWDHVSGIDDLAGVPVLVSAAGKRFLDTHREDTQLMNSFPAGNFKPYDFEGGPYLGFPQSHDVWGDGSVVIVPAPGHTPDSVVVFVNLPSGTRYALLGDLVFQMEGIDLPAEKPWMLRMLIGEDNERVHHDLAAVKAAAKKFPQLHLLPAHDSRAFKALPVFPASAG